MRKLSLIIILSMILSVLSVPSFASNINNDEIKVIEENKEITDLKVLEKRALEGISDIDSEKEYKILSNVSIKKEKNGIEKNLNVNSITEDGVNSNTEDVINASTYSTTQRLKVTSQNDVVTTKYATTVFANATCTRNDSGWDSTGSVKATSTMYWVETQIGGADCYYLDRGTGGWSIHQPGLSIKNGYVTGGDFGPMPDVLGLPSSQTYTYTNTNCSDFDYEFDIAPAVKCSYSGISLNMICTLKKGNATWKFEFDNSING